MRPMLPLLLATTLLAAGCVTTPDEVEGAAEEILAADALTTSEVPFTFDGSIGPVVYACPLLTCAGQAMGERYTELDVDGTLTGTNLTMSWDASSPLTSQLRFGIGWGEDSYESVEGASPLVLTLDGLNVTADDDPYLWVWIVTPAPMGVLHLATPQSFAIEGTLLTAAEAAEADMSE